MVRRGLRVLGAGAGVRHNRRERRLDDAVLGAADRVVAPAGEEVGAVEDDGALDRGHVDEDAALVRFLDLQPAGRVLEEEGDAAVISVGAGPHAARAEMAARRGRVVQEPEGVVARADKRVEEMLVDAQGDGDGAHYHRMQYLAVVEEIHHRFPELDPGCARWVGPLVLLYVAFAADFKTLLHVLALAGAVGFHFLLGGTRAGLFAPDACVSSVCARCRPGQRILLGLGTGKKRGGEGEDVREEGGRDGRVGKVEETRSVKSGKKGLGGRVGERGWIEERRERDELYQGKSIESVHSFRHSNEEVESDLRGLKARPLPRRWMVVKLLKAAFLKVTMISCAMH